MTAFTAVVLWLPVGQDRRRFFFASTTLCGCAAAHAGGEIDDGRATRFALLAAVAISSAIFGCVSPGPRCLCRYLLNSCCAMSLSGGFGWENRSPFVLR